MATNTTNLSLIKPDLTDKIRIAQINQNMDIIDEKLGPVGSTSLQSQVTPLTTKTANYDKLIENGTDLNSLLTTGVYKSPATAAGVHTLSNCPIETPFVMVVRGDGEVDGCVQLLCGGVSIYTRRGTGSGFPAEWTVPTGGATPSGEYSIDDLYDAIDELLADAKDEIVAELIDDTAGEGDTGKVWSADKVATTFDEKANVDGYYDDLTAGNAEQLISTVNVKDTALYTFRTSGGSADIGDREVNKLIGGTIVWNQILSNGNFVDDSGWGIVTSSAYETIAVANGTITMTVATKNASNGIRRTSSIIPSLVGHKLLFSFSVNPSNSCSVRIGSSSPAAGKYGDTSKQITANAWNNVCKILEVESGNTTTSLNVYLDSTGVLEADSTVKVKSFTVFDLTKMFGSTIADYIYGLETATPGAGVAWFKRYFPKDYYAYNAGELMSVNVASHDMVGFNAWDEEWEVGGIDGTTGQNIVGNDRFRSKNYIKVIPGANYYFAYKGSLTTPSFYVCKYDANKNFIRRNQIIRNTVSVISEDCHYIRFFLYNGGSEYNNDICINLSWDGERDGEYEAYEKHTYPIGNVELRGIPKLDADNHLQYNGDTYESDGTVTRKYDVVDLGSLDWANIGSYKMFSSGGVASKIRLPATQNEAADWCMAYGLDTKSYNKHTKTTNYTMSVSANSGSVLVTLDTSRTYTVSEFKEALSGTYLIYGLAAPTTETADPYQNPQIVDDFGTEEYVDRGVATSVRDVSIPVGHETYYQANLRAKLEMAPNSPADGDGDYVVRQTSGMNEYIKLENAEAIIDLDAKKADIDGYYEQMTVGNAEQLVSTVGITDKVPYNFRTSGGSADIGDRMVDKIIGGTVAWNQLVPTNRKSGNKTPPGSNTYDLYNTSNIPVKGGHVYFVSVDYTYSGERTDIRPYIQFGTGGNTTYVRGGSDKFFNVGSIGKTQRFGGFVRAMVDLPGFNLGMTSTSTITSADTWSFDNLMCINITQMFGSTIAEYTVTLDQVDGVPWFTKLFPKPYYAYNAGELMSVKALSHNTVGFNAWDEEWELGSFDETTGAKVSGTVSIRSKNYISVIPGAKYYYKSSFSSRRLYYDANKNFLSIFNMVNGQIFTVPDNAYYMMFRSGSGTTTYENNVCINLSWDGERNGEYEPYVRRSYPLGDVELRGIPKLDANNSLYYDGDEYESDGTVTRKYGIVDLGTLTWTAQSISNNRTAFTTPFSGLDGIPYGGIGSQSLEYCPSVTNTNYTQKVQSASSWGTDAYVFIRSTGILPLNTFAIIVSDTDYTDATAFKMAMDGKYLVYKLATPTTETTDAFQNPQIVDDFGTEEYADTRDVPIPVGHETVYQPNLRAKLEMSPDSPDGDGDYIVRQSNGENTYVPLVIPAELPTAPTTDGTYVLKVTVSSGTPTLTWVAQ